jgi:hypothetical protein
VRLRLLNIAQEDSQPTPTVEARVVRTEATGVAFEFLNSTGKHLWQSVQRVREELAIGRDYFQVHQSIALTNARNQLLVVQQHGKWRLPGCYLVVGEDWRTALMANLHKELGFDGVTFVATISVDSAPAAEVPEAAILQLTHHFQCGTQSHRLVEGCPYRAARWLGRSLQADEITFVSERQRRIAVALLDQFRDRASSTPAASAD